MKTEQSCALETTHVEVKELHKLSPEEEEDDTETQESKYADLELDVDAEPERQCRLAERNQMSVLVDNSSSEALLRATEQTKEMAITSKKKDSGVEALLSEYAKEALSDPKSLSNLIRLKAKADDCQKDGEKSEQHDSSDPTNSLSDLSPKPKGGQEAGEDKNTTAETDENDLRSRISESDDWESDDGVSLLLSHYCVPCVTEVDESHYITTHEIQLSELSDHEGEVGVGSTASWEVEDDNRVFSFVDYASFDEDTDDGTRDKEERERHGVALSTESDPSDSAAKFSSDESVSKPQQQQQQSAGQIHLSIRTSRAINDPGSIQEQGNNILYHHGDMGRYVLRGVDCSSAKADTLYDRAKCFIAAPGRLHFGKLKGGKKTRCYSSGESSSAVSELDDADKEVRNLTAKSFKSLAYPYLDAINFSACSSESSASEHHGKKGVNNRWSTFVDLKYGGNMDMTQGGLRDHQSVLSHNKNSLEIAKNIDNRGYKGIVLASIKPPNSNKLITLNSNPHNAKKIELMGKLGQSGVIRLTETLNFRCNVNSIGEERETRTNFAKNAEGSRSADEVTNALAASGSQQRRGASSQQQQQPSGNMEDAHKKAVFASSLLKNVISKKMQFEQERKMERGEIRESRRASSPGLVHLQDGEMSHSCRGGNEMHRQNSNRFSESVCSSDYTIMCADDLEDFVESGSLPETNLNLEPVNEAGIDATKKGSLEASVKGTLLLRSQNSAFRCWKDEELEFQKDHKNNQTAEGKSSCSAHDKDNCCEGDRYSSGGDKLTKMSHLFVPNIQLLSSDGEAGQQLQQSGNYSQCGNGGGTKVCSDNTLYVADSRHAKSKSPEIKINLRTFRDDKTESFGLSKLRAPNIATSSLSRTDDSKCQALAAALKGESSDKVPHFMVRDIRDNKGKLQTPIHQVRDVRKLVKSSYHFVSLDNNENKNNLLSFDSHLEQNKQMPYRNPNSVSPIVIKCQSVNTNSNGKQAEDLAKSSKSELFDEDRLSPEGAKGAPVQKAVRAAIDNSNISNSEGLKIESSMASKSDTTDMKPESKIANQGALEKLQAAVKTMEQLYVFERNEWKRKNNPRPLTDSHVLSLISSEELGGPEDEIVRPSNVDRIVTRDSYPNAGRTPPPSAAAVVEAYPGNEGLLSREDAVFQSPISREERPVAKSMQATTATANTNTTGNNKNMFNLISSIKASANAKTAKPNTNPQTTPFSIKNVVPKSPKLPVSLKISQKKVSTHEGVESREVERFAHDSLSISADNENYLTIPVKSYANSDKQTSSADRTPLYALNTQKHQTAPPGHFGSGQKSHEDLDQHPRRSSMGTEACSPEIPPATIYHSLPLGMSMNQPQMYCFSPTVTPTPTLDPFQATQRKMLLDPTTGNYYLVDTPVQPATKRLFDPETGQYVDVPMPQPPMTPVPMPMSPLALSPGAYGPTYMVCPSFMPTPSMIPARTLVQSQMLMQSEVESAERAFLQQQQQQQVERTYNESPYYIATAKTPQLVQQQVVAANRPPQGFSSIKQPVISINTQQGPRIIAPPSFDGTTMSFVVEHR